MNLLNKLRSFHPLRRLVQALWDLIATAFYLLAAKFMRRFPRLARPTVYYCLYAYFLLRDGYREHKRVLRRLGAILAHLFCALLIPLFMLYLSQAITLQSFSAAEEWLFSHGAAVSFTLAPLCALNLLLFALFRSYFFGALTNALLITGFTLVNHYKTLLNGFPLMLSDFSFLSGMEDILAYALPEITVVPLVWECLLLFLLAVFAAAVVSGCLSKNRRTSFLLLSLSLPLLLSLFGPSAFAAQAAALTEDCATQEERLSECGILGGLYGAYTNSKNADYSSYNSDNVNRLSATLFLEKAEQEEKAASTVTPHIFIVLSESFFDVTRYENFVFEEDPLPVFHALSEEHTNGRFISSTYAGGTGYVEMEVLTGINNYAMKETDSLCSLSQDDGEDVYELFPSLARDLAEGSGYETYYIHSHTDALYDRSHIMGALGFEEVIFEEDFETSAAHDGYFVSDKALVEEVIHRFEGRSEGAPVFMQITSMENHRPYTKEKYADESPVSFRCDALNEEAMTAMDSFIRGLTHADAALGQMVDYFENCGESVMIVFYGDHLPTMQMSDNSLLYEAIGRVSSGDSMQWSSEELKEMLSTDYLIWTNYESETAPDREESSLFLGANALYRAGVETSPFLHWLTTDAAQVYLADRPRLFVAADGTPASAADEASAQTLRDHELMIYDLLYGEQLLAKYFRTADDGKTAAAS